MTKNCCNQWTHVIQHESICPTWVHWLQQIFSHLALNQKWIEISAWNFQHLFITNLRTFLIKRFWPLLNQPASHSPFLLKLWMPLATIFVEIFQKEKKGEVLDPFEKPLERIFQYLLKNGVLKFFERAVGPPSRCPWIS